MGFILRSTRTGPVQGIALGETIFASNDKTTCTITKPMLVHLQYDYWDDTDVNKSLNPNNFWRRQCKFGLLFVMTVFTMYSCKFVLLTMIWPSLNGSSYTRRYFCTSNNLAEIWTCWKQGWADRHHNISSLATNICNAETCLIFNLVDSLYLKK